MREKANDSSEFGFEVTIEVEVPKPYEQFLSNLLTQAMAEADDAVLDVVVSGRTATVEYVDRVDRFVLADGLLDKAAAITRGDDQFPRGEITLSEYNEAEAARPFDDRTKWIDEPPHWCAAPGECQECSY